VFLGFARAAVILESISRARGAGGRRRHGERGGFLIGNAA
jgi:hypothetical protein